MHNKTHRKTTAAAGRERVIGHSHWDGPASSQATIRTAMTRECCLHRGWLKNWLRRFRSGKQVHGRDDAVYCRSDMYPRPMIPAPLMQTEPNDSLDQTFGRRCLDKRTEMVDGQRAGGDGRCGSSRDAVVPPAKRSQQTVMFHSQIRCLPAT